MEILDSPPRPVEMRFELAALRLADDWLRTGTVRASAADLQVAREFLVHVGFRVEELPGLQVRLLYPSGEATEMSREAAVMAALRRLAAREARRRRDEYRLAIGPALTAGSRPAGWPRPDVLIWGGPPPTDDRRPT